MKFRKQFHHLVYHSRWKLSFKTLPYVVAILLFKYVVHIFGLEFLSLNTFFTAIISANVFLIGFLISGVLADYKESEKLPGDIAGSVETMADEALILHKKNKSKEAKDFLVNLDGFLSILLDWFYKKERTEPMKRKILSFNDNFLALEGQIEGRAIVRLKQEQCLLRKMVTRMHTIRGTSFLGTGYALAETITAILMIGLVFLKDQSFAEGIYFVFFASFILICMIYFIKDLDNPFGYYEKDDIAEEISLKPILDAKKRIETYCQHIG